MDEKYIFHFHFLMQQVHIFTHPRKARLNLFPAFVVWGISGCNAGISIWPCTGIVVLRHLMGRVSFTLDNDNSNAVPSKLHPAFFTLTFPFVGYSRTCSRTCCIFSLVSFRKASTTNPCFFDRCFSCNFANNFCILFFASSPYSKKKWCSNTKYRTPWQVEFSMEYQ